MSTTTGLAEPSGPLRGFPHAGEVNELHRLTDHPGAWWFGSVSTGGGGRFDLPAPRGTCHTAESLDGALVEKLLRAPTKVVVAERLDELLHATITVFRTPPTADLTAPAATGHGLNAEIHTTLDHPLTRRWAQALDRAGFRGLRHRLRGDATLTTAGRALFGRAGLHRRAPAGMHTSVSKVDRDEVAELLTARGVEVRPIPSAVPIVAPS